MDSNQDSQIFTEGPPIVYGDFGQRLLAWIIDGLILTVPNYVINRLMGYDMLDGFYAHGGSIGYSSTHWNFVTMILNWLYFAVQESSPAGATIGKRAMGLTVTTQDGYRISFARATGRYFGKYISMVILLIGFLMVLWDDKRQGLHDKMAGTLVIRS